MSSTTLIREKPVKPPREAESAERIPPRPPTAAHPEGVGSAAATADSAPILTRAETAPCTCPEHCERDHEND